MKVIGFEEALRRPGFTADGERATWNHRVVRRYRKTPAGLEKELGPEVSWLEVTEVHYRNGKPSSFAIDLSAPSAGGDGEADKDSLDELRTTMIRMRQALERPILDERTDFQLTTDEDDAPTTPQLDLDDDVVADYLGCSADQVRVMRAYTWGCPGCSAIHPSYPMIDARHHPCCPDQGTCADCHAPLDVGKGHRLGLICQTCYVGDDTEGPAVPRAAAAPANDCPTVPGGG